MRLFTKRGRHYLDARSVDGRRVRLSLRTESERIAQAYRDRLVDIIESHHAGVQPSAETRRWSACEAPSWLHEALTDQLGYSLPETGHLSAQRQGQKGCRHSSDSSIRVLRDLLLEHPDYLEQTGRSAKYAGEVRNVINKFMDHAGSSMVTAKTVHSFVESEISRGNSLPTVSLNLSNLRRAFDHAISQGHISSNAVAEANISIRIRDKDRQQRACFTESEIARLDQHADSRLSVCIRLGATMGFRISEAIAIRDSWLCAETGECVIPARFSKSGRQDILPVSEAVSELETVEHGLSRVQIARKLYALMDSLEISKEVASGRRSFHSLRHTYGTMLARRNVHPENARKLMRHSSVKTTLAYYTHLTSDDLKQAQGAISLPR